ncbi:hypothetical protein ACS0TY_016007 [Phlomoides rotata]
MSSFGMTSGRKSSRNVAIGSNSLIWGIVWCLYRTNQGECALKHKLKWKSGLNTGSNAIDYGGMKMCVTDGNVGPDGSEFLYMHGMKDNENVPEKMGDDSSFWFSGSQYESLPETSNEDILGRSMWT